MEILHVDLHLHAVSYQIHISLIYLAGGSFESATRAILQVKNMKGLTEQTLTIVQFPQLDPLCDGFLKTFLFHPERSEVLTPIHPVLSEIVLLTYFCSNAVFTVRLIPSSKVTSGFHHKWDIAISGFIQTR